MDSVARSAVHYFLGFLGVSPIRECLRRSEKRLCHILLPRNLYRLGTVTRGTPAKFCLDREVTFDSATSAFAILAPSCSVALVARMGSKILFLTCHPWKPPSLFLLDRLHLSLHLGGCCLLAPVVLTLGCTAGFLPGKRLCKLLLPTSGLCLVLHSRLLNLVCGDLPALAIWGVDCHTRRALQQHPIVTTAERQIPCTGAAVASNLKQGPGHTSLKAQVVVALHSTATPADESSIDEQ